LVGALVTTVENKNVMRELLSATTATGASDEDCWFLVGPRDDIYVSIDERRTVNVNLHEECINGNAVSIHIPQDGVRRSFNRVERNESDTDIGISTTTKLSNYWYGEDSSDGSTFKFTRDKYGNVYASLNDFTSKSVFELEVEGNSTTAYTRTHSSDLFLPTHIMTEGGDKDRKLNIDPNGEFIEVTTGVCETHGYKTMTNPEECTMATDALKRTVIWGRYGEYRNVVTGCSVRFSYTSSTLVLFNQQGYCDPNYKMDDWTFTRCQCSIWMPCLCRNTGPAPSPTDDEPTEHIPDFFLNVLNETERSNLDTEDGKIAIFSVEEIKDIFLYHDQDYSHLMTDDDIFGMTHIKENQGFVLRAKCNRTGREDGLMIWSNSTHAFGSWNPRDSSSAGDFMDDDVLTLLDYCPLSYGRRIATSSEVTYSLSNDTTTEWNLPAEMIQFGQCGLVGQSGGAMEIHYELTQALPVWGVWSDSVDLPYDVMYEDIFSGTWMIQEENLTGTELFPAAVFAKKWKIRWESTDISKSNGLTTPSGGGGLHAQLIVQYLIAGITVTSPSATVAQPSALLTPTTTTQVSSTYVQVTSGTCETDGYETLTSLQECMTAASELGQSGFINSSSEHIDVVTGCSVRFSVSTGTMLYFNEPNNCDPTKNMDLYTYTGCECTIWMPCVCKIPANETSSTNSNSTGVDTNSTEIGTPTPAPNNIVPFSDIPENATCVCDGDDLEQVYRFMNGELHLYPNATIATSWDENWREYQITVDCADISFGEPLEMKVDNTPPPTVTPTLSPVSQTIGSNPDPGPSNPGPSDNVATPAPAKNDATPAPNPDESTETSEETEVDPGLPEGQAAVCDGDTSQIFRWTNGKLHLYPTSEIANSWDEDWRKFKYIECTGLDFGDPMQMMLLFAQDIEEGATVQCEDDYTKVYRWENGELRYFPSTQILNSWDEQWREKLKKIDCSDLPHGEPMELSEDAYIIPEGKSVQCEGDPSKIFRYEDGKLHHYPSGIIANSWDQDWRSYRVIDCTGLTFGDTMTMVSSYEQVATGRTVQCANDYSKLYRVVDGQLRHYSNVEVAYSWNIDWRNFIVIDCRFFTFGDPMEEYSNTPTVVKLNVPLDQRYIEISGHSCEYYGHKSLTSAEECTAAATEMGLTIRWGPFGGYRDVVNGCSSRFTISKESLLHFNEPGTCDPNYNIQDWAFTSCKCTVVMPCLCSNSLFGKPPAVPIDNVEEGQSCKCQKDETGKIYRWVNQQLHHYPTMEIALSWDENWRRYKVVDCDDILIGDPMEINPLYQPTIPEGKSVQCSDDYEKLYRYTNDTLRHYPTATIAASWNPDWKNVLRDVDCAEITIGEPMELNVIEEEDKLEEGATVQCLGGDGKLYRWMDGELRHYPSGTIAESWNPAWKNAIHNIECEDRPIGEPLELFEPTPIGADAPDAPGPEEPDLGIPDDKAVQCEGDTSMTYTWMEGELHHYPSSEIAESWGQDLSNYVIINCTDVPIGQPMMPKDEATPDLPEGSPVMCNDGSGRLYRWTEGQLRYYPSGVIAYSWDPNWQKATYIYCWFLEHGPDMELKEPEIEDDGPIPEGQSCTCTNLGDGKIYRWMNGELHHYPTGAIADSWDPSWRQIKMIDCTDLPIGWPMDFWVPTAAPVVVPAFYTFSSINYSEGQSIQCEGDTSSLFRWMYGQLRSYPNDFIANSWDPNYNDYIVVDCTELSFGPPMLLNGEVTSLISVPDGTTIACDGDLGKLYRWSNFVLRLYPDISVANTWNEDWRDFILVDCSNLLFGPPMEPFTPFDIHSIQSHEICLIADNLSLSADNAQTQELCPTSQWATTFFKDQYYVIMDRFVSKMEEGSQPGKCHCLAACITIEVLCEVECRQSLMEGSCTHACGAACKICEHDCIT